MLRRESLRGIHVGSIATAQGSEWDYVILSTVRSEKGGRLGLLSDPHTMNVAITRARHGLVVLCEQSALEGCPNWSALLQHARSKGLITKEDPEVRAAAPVRRPLTDEEVARPRAGEEKILSAPRQESSSKSRSSSRSRSPLRCSPSGRSSSKPSMHTVVFQGLERACGA